MKTVCLLSCLLPLFGHALEACGEEIIIKAGATGMNNDQYSEPEGKWIDSRIPPASAKSSAPGLSARGECGSRKILFWRTSGAMTTAPACARFTPRFSAPGKYSVHATWTSAANAAPVHYVVRHAGGESLVRIRQDGRGAAGGVNSDRWIPLGDYLFAPDAGAIMSNCALNRRPVPSKLRLRPARPAARSFSFSTSRTMRRAANTSNGFSPTARSARS